MNVYIYVCVYVYLYMCTYKCINVCQSESEVAKSCLTLQSDGL